MPDLIELHAGDMRLALDPRTGGAISALTWRGVALLRQVMDPRLKAQQGRAVAGYPLIPYANRIDHGRFTCDGAAFQLAANFGDEPHAIHGNGWMRRWTVADTAPDRVRLTLDHAPPHDPAEEWPFAYRAEQIFEVSTDRLRITLSVENRDTRSWPAGLGLHPYVARDAGTTLRFQAGSTWTKRDDGLPGARVPIGAPADFSRDRALDATEFDACYAGWHGAATVTRPDEDLVLDLSAEGLDHLQLYAPPGRDFFGLEPVSNMPDAINRMATEPAHGLHVLAPGQTLHATVTFRIAGRGVSPA